MTATSLDVLKVGDEFRLVSKRERHIVSGIATYEDYAKDRPELANSRFTEDLAISQGRKFYFLESVSSDPSR